MVCRSDGERHAPDISLQVQVMRCHSSHNPLKSQVVLTFTWLPNFVLPVIITFFRIYIALLADIGGYAKRVELSSVFVLLPSSRRCSPHALNRIHKVQRRRCIHYIHYCYNCLKSIFYNRCNTTTTKISAFCFKQKVVNQKFKFFSYFLIYV